MTATIEERMATYREAQRGAIMATQLQPPQVSDWHPQNKIIHGPDCTICRERILRKHLQRCAANLHQAVAFATEIAPNGRHNAGMWHTAANEALALLHDYREES